MEDIERLMMNETEHYDTAYKVGKEEGVNLGKTTEKVDIAKNLLIENVNINIIMNATGLTKEQINSLL